MRITYLLPFALLACGNIDSGTPTQGEPPQQLESALTSPSQEDGVPAVQTGNLVTHVLKDEAMGGVEAVSVQLPADFAFGGRVMWQQIGGMVNLPTYEWQAVSEKQNIVLYQHRAEKFIYQSGPGFEYTRQLAQQFGQPIDNPAPVSATEMVRQFILPQLHELKNIRILSERNVPDIVVEITGKPLEKPLPGAVVYLRAERNGLPMKVLCAAVRFEMTQSFPGMYGTDGYTQWGMNSATTLAIPESKYDALEKELLGYVNGAQVNPQWSQLVRDYDSQQARAIDQQTQLNTQQHQQRMQAQQQQFNSYQRSYRETQAAYDAQNQSWQNNQNIQSQGAEQFIDAIREESNYVDPNTGVEHKRSMHYQYQWTNGDNEFIESNDPNFNPNTNNKTTPYYQLEPERE